MKVRLSPAVSKALRARRPVVALETSVVAQGLPYPHNLEAARACEEAARKGGATPASIAVIDGALRAGLSPEELGRLAEGREPLLKIGSRDLAAAVAGRRTGGTTVSATCEIAAAAGIRVFATGGIGGVHRGAEEHFDVSQDLWAISRFPVAVVCAGAKSVLDLPKTLELLESLAVPVYGVGTAELPGFYSRETGLRLEHQVAGAAEAAAQLWARVEELEQGGVIFAVPPPEATSLSRTEAEREIEEALRAAEAAGVRGKAVTPFLLAELARRSGGKTLEANLALLVNNVEFAARLAVAYGARGSGARSPLPRPARAR